MWQLDERRNVFTVHEVVAVWSLGNRRPPWHLLWRQQPGGDVSCLCVGDDVADVDEFCAGRVDVELL